MQRVTFLRASLTTSASTTALYRQRKSPNSTTTPAAAHRHRPQLQSTVRVQLRSTLARQARFLILPTQALNIFGIVQVQAEEAQLLVFFPYPRHRQLTHSQ